MNLFRTLIAMLVTIYFAGTAVAADANPPIETNSVSVDFSNFIIGPPETPEYSGSIIVDQYHKIHLSCSAANELGTVKAPCEISNGALSIANYTWAPYRSYTAYLTFDPPATSIAGITSGSIGPKVMSTYNKVRLQTNREILLQLDNLPANFSYPFISATPSGANVLRITGSFPETVGGRRGDPEAYYFLGLNSLSWTTASKTTPPVDLAIGQISISPSKVELDNDHSISANKPVVIQVPILGSGIPSTAAGSVAVSLSIGSQAFPSQTVKLSDIVANNGRASFDVIAPSEMVGTQTLTIALSSTSNETNLSNNLINETLHVLCNLEDSGKSVNFESQVDPLWKDDPFGIVANSANPGTIGEYGCSMTDFMMVSKMYGIKNTPIGSPLNPEVNSISTLPGLKGELLTPKTLNWAFQNYKTKIESSGSVALNGKNDPIWEGMAQVARAGYRAQCRNPANNCNPSEASNIISLSSIKLAGFNSAQGSADQKAVIKEICRGNPVILKFKKVTHGQHYMLATGMRVDSNGAISYRLHNPGSKDGADTFQDVLRIKYPTISGYVIYKSAHDPSMMTLAAPLNVHFVVTDSLGRRSGFDPNADITYNEIPGASYGEQSIDTPSETGFVDKTLVAERYYVSTSDTPAGNYQIKTFAISGGNYYLDLRTTDRDGYLNDSNFKAGTLAAGQSESTTFVHSIESVPEPTANLDISNYIINLRSKGFLDVGLIFGGKIKPFVSQPIKLTSAFKVRIGGVNGYRLEIPASKFKISTLLKKTIYTYLSADAKIILTESGEFEVILNKSSLLGVSLEKAGYLRIDVDALYSDALTKLKCEKNICVQSRK